MQRRKTFSQYKQRIEGKCPEHREILQEGRAGDGWESQGKSTRVAGGRGRDKPLIAPDIRFRALYGAELQAVGAQHPGGGPESREGLGDREPAGSRSPQGPGFHTRRGTRATSWDGDSVQATPPSWWVRHWRSPGNTNTHWGEQ